jgi:hypothetical protein
MKKAFINIALLLAAAIFAFSLSEILLAIFLPLKEKRTRYMRTREVFQYDERRVRFDQELGYMTKPNLSFPFSNSATFYQKEFATTVETNSLGFRDDERSLADPAILLLGDSFGFGWGVEKSESCEKILEDSCSVKVLNLSVPGYGTIQEFLLLRRWSLEHRVSGKTALFLFHPNDLQDNLGRGLAVYPTVVRHDDIPMFSQPSEADFHEWLDLCRAAQLRGVSRISYVTYLLEYGAMKLWNEFKRGAIDEETTAANRRASGQGEFQILGLIIALIKAFAEGQNLNIVFVYIPAEDDNEIFSKAAPIFSAVALPLIDLRGALAKDDYYRYDGHWKPSGHYKAAREIKKFLSGMNK